MTPPAALFFGSLGTLAECSDLHRRALNGAFRDGGLAWRWDRDAYAGLRRRPGGLAMIEGYARARGDVVDAPALLRATAARFAALVGAEGLTLRPGVAATLAATRRRGLPAALCSTAAPAQVRAVMRALRGALPADAFAWIGDGAHAARPKPAPDIYRTALARLDLPPERVVVIEDTPERAAAAAGEGLRVLGFPGLVAAGRDFPPGLLVVDRLQPRLLDIGAPVRSALA